MQYQQINSMKPKKPIHVKASDYEKSLVTTNYRESNIYVVIDVCEDLKPESSFPSADYYNYIEYYNVKYSISVENTKQPMIQVKPISKKINSIKPR